MAEEEQNRSEDATPFKKQEARRKGSVPKSLDMNSLAILGAGVAVLHFTGSSIARDEMALFRGIFSNAHGGSFEVESVAGFIASLLAGLLGALAPLLIALVAMGILINVVQSGPVFSLFPLKPDLQRINPVTGLKRMFSMRLVVDTVKSVLKLAILGAVLYSAIRSAVPSLMTSNQVGPGGMGALLVDEVSSVLLKLLVAFAFVTMIDAVYSRWDYAKRLRMSRREIRDELKNREGDPRIKARLRELQREAVKRARSLSRVKDADVLITNPTHFAVAIKYERELLDAPAVVAKGAGFLAGRMRATAQRSGVPIIENKRLARALFYRVGIEQVVPVEHYDVLAKILYWAYAIRRRSTTVARGI